MAQRPDRWGSIREYQEFQRKANERVRELFRKKKTSREAGLHVTYETYKEVSYVKFTRADGKVTVGVTDWKGRKKPGKGQVVWAEVFGGRLGVLVELAKREPGGDLILVGRYVEANAG